MKSLNLIRQLCIFTCIASMLLFSQTAVWACPEKISGWFTEECEYESVSPTSMQIVYAKEYPDSGHTHTYLGSMWMVIEDYEEFKREYSHFPNFYDMDSKLEGLPSLNEQYAAYSESFFETHTLIMLTMEGHHYKTQDGAIVPSPAPKLSGIYVQHDMIFVDDLSGERPSGEVLHNQPLEYYTFIEVEKEEYEALLEGKKWYFFSEKGSYEIDAPNTSDPTLPLLAAVIPAAAAPVLLWKRKKARI